MTSSPHGPLCPGLHTCYNDRYKPTRNREVEQIEKTGPSSDCRLQLACMKLESLVIADQLCCGEYVPEPCTHRPSSHGSREYPKSRQFGRADGKLGDRD